MIVKESESDTEELLDWKVDVPACRGGEIERERGGVAKASSDRGAPCEFTESFEAIATFRASVTEIRVLGGAIGMALGPAAYGWLRKGAL